METCKQINIQEVGDVSITNTLNEADYVLGTKNILERESGNVLSIPVRIPTGMLVPTGNNNNIFAIEANNEELSVPATQVLPAYLLNTGTAVRVVPADATHPADFLVLKVEAGMAYCQSTGVATIMGGHEYQVIGAEYYQSKDAGQVTTSSAETGRKLFKPVSKYQLLINL